MRLFNLLTRYYLFDESSLTQEAAPQVYSERVYSERVYSERVYSTAPYNDQQLCPNCNHFQSTRNFPTPGTLFCAMCLCFVCKITLRHGNGSLHCIGCKRFCDTCQKHLSPHSFPKKDINICENCVRTTKITKK